jgi:hypothetical protein
MSTRFVKTESYFGRGDASIALAISSLKVVSERPDGRPLDCCILTDWDVVREKCKEVELRGQVVTQ